MKGADIVLIEEYKLVIEKFVGEVDYDAIVHVSQALWDIPGYCPSLSGIIDLRGCDFTLNLRSILPLIKFFKRSTKTSKGLAVIIADGNSNIAKSFIAKHKMASLINLQVVTLPESATQLLGVPMSVFDSLHSGRMKSIRI